MIISSLIQGFWMVWVGSTEDFIIVSKTIKRKKFPSCIIIKMMESLKYSRNDKRTWASIFKWGLIEHASAISLPHPDTVDLINLNIALTGNQLA